MKKALVILVALLSTLCLTAPALAYLGNPRTMKFHNDNCRTIRHRENFVEIDSREEAIEEGYVPCQVCYP
ncbi:Ada metal-binding domain-containing protein [uncultured Acidaminococcus sp.]|jgi:methylphosphotriester-DNA--protein-cysteine methyltransferase|uniref:Ada metal-binding domain-containing protein n=1 Tax=uncultured Acidaminococcus sp. TaxID=352152 RepID=UPI0026DD4314|nr:Ada metal-binding domain-containing protein [uncultured Acidaminococcus sp.]